MVRDGYASRMAELTGLDLFETISRNLYSHLSDADGSGPLFAGRLATGRGGVADGAGFHEYDDDSGTVIRRRNERLAAVRRALD